MADTTERLSTATIIDDGGYDADIGSSQSSHSSLFSVYSDDDTPVASQESQPPVEPSSQGIDIATDGSTPKRRKLLQKPVNAGVVPTATDLPNHQTPPSLHTTDENGVTHPEPVEGGQNSDGYGTECQEETSSQEREPTTLSASLEEFLEELEVVLETNLTSSQVRAIDASDELENQDDPSQSDQSFEPADYELNDDSDSDPYKSGAQHSPTCNDDGEVIHYSDADGNDEDMEEARVDGFTTPRATPPPRSPSVNASTFEQPSEFGIDPPPCSQRHLEPLWDTDDTEYTAVYTVDSEDENEGHPSVRVTYIRR